MDKELRKLIFGDVLDEEELEKLGGLDDLGKHHIINKFVGGLGIDEDLSEEAKQQTQEDANMTPIRAREEASEESEEEKTPDKVEDSLDLSAESSSSSGLGIQSNENSFQVSDVDEDELPLKK